MTTNRILPDEAYDFWAYDRRDGEEGPKRDTIADARKDARSMRREARSKPRVFFPETITVKWAVNECKVVRLIAKARGQ